MNVYLNGNWALMPVIHTDILLTPKKNAALPLVSKLFCFVLNIAGCIFVLEGCKQSNYLTMTKC